MKNSDSRQIREAYLLPRQDAGDGAVSATLNHLLPSPPQDPAQCASAPDLKEEAANMLRLALSQEGLVTPLSISSRQAQVVLGQF